MVAVSMIVTMAGVMSVFVIMAVVVIVVVVIIMRMIVVMAMIMIVRVAVVMRMIVRLLCVCHFLSLLVLSCCDGLFGCWQWIRMVGQVAAYMVQVMQRLAE